MPAPSVQRAARSPESTRHTGTPASLGIGETCQRYGISFRAIRHYEALGLLSPRRIDGARVYGAGELHALTLILRFKAIGYSLTETRRHLRLYGLPPPCPDAQPTRFVAECERALTALARRRENIDAMLMELRVIRDDVARRLSARAGTDDQNGHSKEPDAAS